MFHTKPNGEVYNTIRRRDVVPMMLSSPSDIYCLVERLQAATWQVKAKQVLADFVAVSGNRSSGKPWSIAQGLPNHMARTGKNSTSEEVLIEREICEASWSVSKCEDQCLEMAKRLESNQKCILWFHGPQERSIHSFDEKEELSVALLKDKLKEHIWAVSTPHRILSCPIAIEKVSTLPDSWPVWLMARTDYAELSQIYQESYYGEGLTSGTTLLEEAAVLPPDVDLGGSSRGSFLFEDDYSPLERDPRKRPFTEDEDVVKIRGFAEKRVTKRRAINKSQAVGAPKPLVLPPKPFVPPPNAVLAAQYRYKTGNRAIVIDDKRRHKEKLQAQNGGTNNMEISSDQVSGTTESMEIDTDNAAKQAKDNTVEGFNRDSMDKVEEEGTNDIETSREEVHGTTEGMRIGLQNDTIEGFSRNLMTGEIEL